MWINLHNALDIGGCEMAANCGSLSSTERAWSHPPTINSASHTPNFWLSGACRKKMQISNNLGKLVWSSASSSALQPLWSSITLMSSPIVDQMSWSKVCLYMVLRLPLLTCPCCGCHNTNFDASSRLCSSRARWPVAPNFCSRVTRQSLLFHRNHMLGTLDFTSSEHWAPFNFC